jgi:dephospho-CoA kinase
MNRRIFFAVLWKLIRIWLLTAADQVVILDAPLLFETKMFTFFVSASVCVSCCPDEQLTRLMRRNGLPKEEAVKRIAAQMPMRDKERRSDFVIDNSGPQTDLPQKVALAFAWMRTQSSIRFPLLVASVFGLAVASMAGLIRGVHYLQAL